EPREQTSEGHRTHALDRGKHDPGVAFLELGPRRATAAPVVDVTAERPATPHAEHQDAAARSGRSAGARNRAASSRCATVTAGVPGRPRARPVGGATAERPAAPGGAGRDAAAGSGRAAGARNRAAPSGGATVTAGVPSGSAIVRAPEGRGSAPRPPELARAIL